MGIADTRVDELETLRRPILGEDATKALLDDRTEGQAGALRKALRPLEQVILNLDGRLHGPTLPIQADMGNMGARPNHTGIHGEHPEETRLRNDADE